MKKYKVGDTVHVVECGNSISRGVEPKHFDKRVIRVGRKYFYIRINSWESAYHIDNGRQKTDYSVFYRIVESEKAYLEEKEAGLINSKIINNMNPYGVCKYSLTQLKAVSEILELEG
jgi:hypothetical protein